MLLPEVSRMVYEDFMPRIGLSLFMEFGVGLERQLTGHASAAGRGHIRLAA